MVYAFLADGLEEIEALAPVDVMRRAGIDVKTVGITGKTVTGNHDIKIEADILPESVEKAGIEAIFLPGGGVGTENLEASAFVREMIDFCASNGILIAAICAAPSILGHMGLLGGKEATAFPSYQKELIGARLSEEYVVQDGQILTGRGMGVSLQFGFKLIEILRGTEKAAEIREQVQWEK